MKNTAIVFLSLLCCALIPAAAEELLTSPDGTIRFTLTTVNGVPFYDVTSRGSAIIDPSGFRFEFKDQPDVRDGLVISSVRRSSVDTTWQPVYGTSGGVRDHYNESVITFRETARPYRSIDVVARAYDDGVAFRYAFPRAGWSDSLFITAERTEFAFAANDSAWWIPANEFAYESLYRHTRLGDIPDANTPITIEKKNGVCLSLHEAALQDYSEMTLRKKEGTVRTFVSSLWPEPDGVCARVALPFATPWRYVAIAARPGGLVESHLLQNLNEPCRIADASWIRPIKFIGIWWGMHTGRYTWYEGPNHGATTARMKEYIDFAAAHNIGGVLAEGWNKGWETWASGVTPLQDFSKACADFDLGEVVRYAKEHGVEFISHHETGGNIPEYERQMDSAFALCRRLGIHYLKTGYAGSILPDGYHHHGQFMVRHYQKAVETAARYQIALDVHESIKPTGLDRTWPNLMSQEAARGNEWNGTYKATPPYHATILPFTRLLAGPYDYTPGIFAVDHSPAKSKRLYCTTTYQLATLVAIYSPMLMAADMIENYRGRPAFAFVEDLPAAWDETRVIDAQLGDYVSIARRQKDQWFVGTLTDEQGRSITLPLSFLKDNTVYVATIYGDSITTDWEKNPEAVEIARHTVTSRDTIVAALSKAGGQTIVLTPAAAQAGNGTNMTAAAAPEVTGGLPPIRTYNAMANAKLAAFAARKTYGSAQTVHRGVGKPVSLKYPFGDRYPASGTNALTDGSRGTHNLSAGDWQGFEGVDVVATIDLKEAMQVKKISIGFLNSPNDWIFYPRTVTFSVSADGKTFSSVGVERYAFSKTDSTENLIEIRDFSSAFAPVTARYVRVSAESISLCPPWHYGRGKKAWVFTDEMVVE